MNGLAPRDQRDVVAEACRAPSVHNIQPTRWRFLPDGQVLLLRALERALPAADPTGHDVSVSVGAAFEGTAIALSRRGLGLSAPERLDGPAGPGLALVARARVLEGGTEDPLARWVERRRAFRGVFERAAPEIRAALGRLLADDTRVIADAGEIQRLAREYDAASVHFLSRSDYEAELYRWMRLKPAHPDWGRDGLNASCMALSPLEAWLAERLLRPSVFAWISRLGLTGAVISEAPAIRSSAAVILFCPPRECDPFQVGRRFYRLWLETTACGCALCPLSALADHEPTARKLAERYRIPEARRLANAFRVGVLRGEPALSPRLPVDELIV